MYSLDNPKEYRFIRSDEADLLEPAEALARWEGVLLKQGRADFWKQFMPSEAVLKRAREMTTANLALKAAAAKSVE